MKVRTAFDLTGTDKGSVHGYDRYYSKFFENYTPESVLEIGVQRAKSLLAWKILFPNAIVHGVDINFTDVKGSFARLHMSGAKVIIYDSTKKDIVDHINSSYDVIIDDGSHYYKDQIRTFKNLEHVFKKQYIIEDFCWNPKVAVKYFNRQGYKNVQVFQSKFKKVVDFYHITKTSKRIRGKRLVHLHMIVVNKN